MSFPRNQLIARLGSSLSRAGIPNHDATLIVGVSGGPDSTALLSLLSEWTVGKSSLKIIAAHFNHKLRPEADLEEQHVRHFANRLGVEFANESDDVAGYAQKQNVALHAAARTLRYRFLAKISLKTRQDNPSQSVYIVTAHHRDDQVETMLMRLFSGSGVEGLAGIKLVAPCPGYPEIPLVRPLLTFRKEELIEYCHERQLPFVEDSSNSDENYPRAVVRHKIVPLIRSSFGEGGIEAINRSGELLRLTADFLSGEIERHFDECRISATRVEIVVDYRAFSSYFCLVRLGILQRCSRILAGEDHRIPLERFQAADDSLGSVEKEIQLGKGISVRRFRDSVHIYSVQAAWEPIKFVPGIHQIPHYGTLIVTNVPVSAAVMPPPDGTLFIDSEQCNLESSIIRPAKPGDLFRPLGSKYSCSVLDLLRDAGKPHHKRNTPVIESDGSIAALLPLRIAHNYRLTAKSRQAYQLTSIFPSPDIK